VYRTYAIPHIIFTHLGKETLEKESDFVQRNPEIILAYDGMTVLLDRSG